MHIPIMSSRVFIGYACILIFMMVLKEIDSQDCGQNIYKSYSDSSVVIKEKGYAKEGLWPWLVAIASRDSKSTSYRPLCSGFLIDRRHVISAAHCFVEKDAELYRARIDNINYDESDEYRISRITIPADYIAGMFYNDIAILTLEREVTSPNASSICLPDEEVSKMNLTDRRIAVAAWGDDSARMGFSFYQQFRTGLRVISNQQCEKRLQGGYFRLRFPYGINQDFICTALEEEGGDVCMTSGGPLMIQNGNRWFAVGITLFGTVCGDPSVPDGYTNITNYLEWITQNTN